MEKLLKIIRRILRAETDGEIVALDDWSAIVALAEDNGVFQYVYRYMHQLDEKDKPTAELVAHMEKHNALEIRTGVLQRCAIEKLAAGLDERGIDYMLFKGSVTKKRYPDEHLRSMGDIDLLYDVNKHEEFLRAMAELGFELKSIGRVHDMYSDGLGSLIEAHRQLVSSSSPFFDYWKDAWGRAERIDGSEHAYKMRDEEEFLFNFTHLVSHFKKGGIGVRFIIDIWIYKQLSMDFDYIEARLSELGLLDFYRKICLLAEKWFGDGIDEDETVDEIEKYVLAGGVFGNTENRKNAVIKGGKVRYFFRVCFPSFEEMQSMFPNLKSRAGLPFAWIRRIFASLTRRRGNVKALFSPLKDGDAESAARLKLFFERCGLN